MSTTHEQPGVGVAAASAGGWPADSRGFDWTFTLLSSWLIGGVFLDGWAHNHGKVDQSFFTPWHAVLYSGFAVIALFLAITLVRNHARGYAWRRAFPTGYGSSVIGAVVFAVGGVGDLGWHTLFGIEKGLEGEISPTHLMLAVGGTLIFTGPLRALWLRTAPHSRPAWAMLLPGLLALTYIFSILTFFTQYASPIVHSRADLQPVTENDLSTALGVTSILLQSAIVMGIILFAVRRWRLPVGSFALLLGLNGLLMSLLAGSAPIIEVGILSAIIGLIADLLNSALYPSAQRMIAWRVFAFVVPVVNYLIYFAVLFALKGSLGWSVHLWTGSIVEAGIVGLLISYLVVPPQMGAGSPTAEV